MSVIEQQGQQVPTGTWTSDPVHSTLEFAVKHMVVATYRGRLHDFTATLVGDGASASLEGTARVESVTTQDENLTGHLLSPDFFDAERFPEVGFRSTRVVRRGEEEIEVDGELTLKGVTKPVTLRGTIAGPAVALGDTERLGLELETTIDRTEFGLTWNAPLPKGGFAVGDEVRITAHLELVKEA